MSDPDVASDFKSPLDRWLWLNRRTGKSLADEVGVHEATISRIRTGDKDQVSDELLDAIRDVTGLKRL